MLPDGPWSRPLPWVPEPAPRGPPGRTPAGSPTTGSNLPPAPRYAWGDSSGSRSSRQASAEVGGRHQVREIRRSSFGEAVAGDRQFRPDEEARIDFHAEIESRLRALGKAPGSVELDDSQDAQQLRHTSSAGAAADDGFPRVGPDVDGEDAEECDDGGVQTPAFTSMCMAEPERTTSLRLPLILNFRGPAQAAAEELWEHVEMLSTTKPPKEGGEGDDPPDDTGWFFRSRLRLRPEAIASDGHRWALCVAALPKGRGSVQARVIRVKTPGLFQVVRWMLYLEDDRSPNRVFLASAARTSARKGSVKPYYVLSCNEHEQRFEWSSPHFLARLSGNVMSTSYVLHGRCLSESQEGDNTPGSEFNTTEREELLALRFKKPTDAPRIMEVVLPKRRTDNAAAVAPEPPMRRRRTSGAEGLSRAWASDGRGRGGEGDAAAQEENAEVGDVHCLSSLSARWDPKRSVYSMNFHGRVGRASAKNFQLVEARRDFTPCSGESMCLQFGRVDEDVFNIDIAHPLSPVQAFAIALTMFDHRPAETLRMYY